MLASAQYRSVRSYTVLKVILGVFLPTLFGCHNEECNGSIVSTVIYTKPAPYPDAGNWIYVDVKNKNDLGVRKTLHFGSGTTETFSNVIIIEDFRNRFTGKKSICFNNDYMTRVNTDGVKVNEEDSPALVLYH
ncbi:MAG: hypothetical protein EOO61_19880 [Hymenobacter sp.]|nr:MAG: hypothetical protein EOO61_19880 [Hymenobacter sp.]